MSSYEDVKATFEYGGSFLASLDKEASILNGCFEAAIYEAQALEVLEQDQALDLLEEIKNDLNSNKIRKLEVLIPRLQEAGFSGTIPRRVLKLIENQ